MSAYLVRLLWLAKILVNAAEVTLGRFVGSEKWRWYTSGLKRESLPSPTRFSK